MNAPTDATLKAALATSTPRRATAASRVNVANMIDGEINSERLENKINEKSVMLMSVGSVCD